MIDGLKPLDLLRSVQWTSSTERGAAELARRIRAGDTSPLEGVDAHIARINESEPHINSLITAPASAASSAAAHRRRRPA